MIISLRQGQPANAQQSIKSLLPITLTDRGISMRLNERHSSNALPSMHVIVDGTLNSLKPEPKNA